MKYGLDQKGALSEHLAFTIIHLLKYFDDFREFLEVVIYMFCQLEPNGATLYTSDLTWMFLGLFWEGNVLGDR